MIRLFNDPIQTVYMIVAFLVAITIHEFAHAYMSDRLGDPTARLMGRLSLNPMAHLDLFGTLMILFAPFGWAKPVPVDPFNLRNPRRDSAIISLAGPIANILMAVVVSILIRLIPGVFLGSILFDILGMIIVLNVNLAIFNLIPIYPLDGYGIVEGLLSERYVRDWQQLKPYGFVFLLFLAFPILGSSSPISNIISPIISIILRILLPNAPII